MKSTEAITIAAPSLSVPSTPPNTPSNSQLSLEDLNRKLQQLKAEREKKIATSA
jgi:hypothetical protein